MQTEQLESRETGSSGRQKVRKRIKIRKKVRMRIPLDDQKNKRKRKQKATLLIFFSLFVVFVVSAMVAFYYFGVEQRKGLDYEQMLWYYGIY
jgi:hypothetical protein